MQERFCQVRRAMFLVKSFKPIREMKNFDQYCALTALIEETVHRDLFYRFFTEDMDSLLVVIKSDEEIDTAEFFYWGEGREKMR